MLYDNKTSVNNKNKSVKYKTLRYLLLKFCQEGRSFLARFLVHVMSFCIQSYYHFSRASNKLVPHKS